MGNQSLKNTTTKLIKKNIESHLLFLWICCSSPLLHLQGQHQGLLGFHPLIHRFVPRPHPRIILEPSSRAEVETSMSWMKRGQNGGLLPTKNASKNAMPITPPVKVELSGRAVSSSPAAHLIHKFSKSGGHRRICKKLYPMAPERPSCEAVMVMGLKNARQRQ